MNIEKDGKTHGVFLLNSNAMGMMLCYFRSPLFYSSFCLVTCSFCFYFIYQHFVRTAPNTDSKVYCSTE